MNQFADIIVIGAGASGMAASICAAEKGKKVLLLEKCDRPGRKILASGNGRCNLMNIGPLRYYGDETFADAVLRHCPVCQISSFFNHYGLILTTESEGRVYPFSNQSSSVHSILKTALEINKVHLLLNQSVSEVYPHENGFKVITADKNLFYSEKVIVACGGSAQPKLGGCNDGYHILSSFGHTIVPQFPALVPLETDRKSISGLSGIRIKCKVSLYESEDILHIEEGELLFTDYGISGICVMQCSRFTHGHRTHVEIDFLFDGFESINLLLEEMKRRKKLFYSYSPQCLLEGMLPGKIAYAVLKQAGIPMRGENAGSLSDQELYRIAFTATHYRVQITGTRNMDYAQVTAGGADCREFNPSNMESKIVSGLFATGEVLNVDGDCGGFNLMFAFSSGMIAGRSV